MVKEWVIGIELGLGLGPGNAIFFLSCLTKCGKHLCLRWFGCLLCIINDDVNGFKQGELSETRIISPKRGSALNTRSNDVRILNV